MMTRRGTAAKRHPARLAFLTENPTLWQDAPGINEDVTDTGRAALDVLHARMCERGLFFKSKGSGDTTTVGQRETIRKMVSELRGEHVGAGHW